MALREGRVVPAVVRLEDLPQVQGWAFVNSLRGWLEAQLELPDGFGVVRPYPEVPHLLHPLNRTFSSS